MNVINKWLIYIVVANGVYQNTVFGMAAKLPFKYTGAVILGTVSIKDTKIREFLPLGWSNQGGWGGKDI